MKTFLPIVFAFVAGVTVLAAPSSSAAQQPKMDVKVFVGFSGTTFVSMLETGRERETFAGWQVGFGPRIRKRKWFAEMQFSFNRWAFSLVDADGVSASGQVNSFELPLLAGYVPYKNSMFKLYLYGGLVNHFNTKIIADVSVPQSICVAEPCSVSEKVRPKDIDFAIYQALARFGVNFDVAMFNFDFNYSISMNSATTTSYRTGYHQLQLNAAYLF